MTEFELLVQTDPVTAFKRLVDGAGNFAYCFKPNEIEDFELELICGKGGGEGEGEYVDQVYAIRQNTKHRAYIRVTGCYDSYNGTTWDSEYKQVFPHQVTRTEYTENR